MIIRATGIVYFFIITIYCDTILFSSVLFISFFLYLSYSFSIIFHTDWRSHSLTPTHTHTHSLFLSLSILFIPILFFPQIGESFEECAIREAKEETNLDLINMKLFHVTNNPNMDNDPNKHYITIFMKVRKGRKMRLE